MQQLTMEFTNDILIDDIYTETYNSDHEEIVKCNMISDLKKGRLKTILKAKDLIDWFCNMFFEFDLEVTCQDLYDIAKNNGIALIN